MITHCDLICVSLITNEVNYPLIKKNRSLYLLFFFLYFHFCEIFLLFIFLLSSFFFGGLALHCCAGAFCICCVQAPYGNGFSCCRAQNLGLRVSVVVAHRL